MASRSIVITGGTTGLGYHTAVVLAREHPECLIVIAARSDKNGAAAAISAAAGRPGACVFRQMDLADLASVRRFAAAWAAPSPEYPPIQALLLNAALQFPGALTKTPAGVETTFAIAHVGHALLFHLLAPHLAAGTVASPTRIVLTSSIAHDSGRASGMPAAKYTSAQDLAYPPADMIDVPGRQRYSSTKLASVMWMHALARRLAAQTTNHVTITALDPGLMPGTGLARETSGFLQFLWVYIMPHITWALNALSSFTIQGPEKSATELARLAVGADVSGISDQYFENCEPVESSKDSQDESKQEDLWDWTIHHVSADMSEEARFQALQ